MVQITEWHRPKTLVDKKYYIEYLREEEARLKAKGRKVEVRFIDKKICGRPTNVAALFANRV